MLAVSNIAQESNENWVLQDTNTHVLQIPRFPANSLNIVVPSQTTAPTTSPIDGEVAICKATTEVGSEFYTTI